MCSFAGLKEATRQKKLRLALRGLNNPEPGSELDVMWVCSWLDDIGLPEYKKAFHDNLIDGRMVNLLTIDELMSLGVSSQVTKNRNTKMAYFIVFLF